MLVASQNDDAYDRQLGPIHLIKYVYLADMAYATYNDGETYTGVKWTFHHFGPWSLQVCNEVEPALKSLGAQRQTFRSTFSDDDCVRWSLAWDKEQFSDLMKMLPLEIKQIVPKVVKQFKSNTQYLLNHVYETKPMLHAAPGEELDFNFAKKEVRQPSEDYIPCLDRLSKKKRAKLKKDMSALKIRFQNSLKEEALQRDVFEKPDDVFDAGLEWLDSLAGEQFPTEGATVRFSDDVWKSTAGGCLSFLNTLSKT